MITFKNLIVNSWKGDMISRKRSKIDLKNLLKYYIWDLELEIMPIVYWNENLQRYSRVVFVTKDIICKIASEFVTSFVTVTSHKIIPYLQKFISSDVIYQLCGSHLLLINKNIRAWNHRQYLHRPKMTTSLWRKSEN